MRKRRRQPYKAPDGKDWRNPEMTVSKNVYRNGAWHAEEWPSEMNTLYMRHLITVHLSPNWQRDPSYNWRRK